MLEQSVSSGEVIVPQDHYFGMGDNRDNSSDNRSWGFIPRDNVIGKPFLIYWSYRASTEDLTGDTVASMLMHAVDLAEHFFTRTRWDRSFRVVRGFPDSEMPVQPLPTNPGNNCSIREQKLLQRPLATTTARQPSIFSESQKPSINGKERVFPSGG
jgi:signal peptidase I